MSELNNIRNLLYVLTTTILFIATTVYFRWKGSYNVWI